MRTRIIVSQGRVADRTGGALVGAQLTGNLFAAETGETPITIGTPEAPRQDQWDVALKHAETTLAGLAEAVNDALDEGLVPLLATNTCAASIATLPAAAAHNPSTVFLWIDAHADFHTPETTESGYLGGMALAATCGLWESGYGGSVDPKRVILVGARDIDPAEQELITQVGVKVIPPGPTMLADVLEAVADLPVWIHVDWDVLEPGKIPAAYRVAGGLQPEDLTKLFTELTGRETGRILGVEFAEFEADPKTGVPVQESIEDIREIYRAVARG